MPKTKFSQSELICLVLIFLAPIVLTATILPTFHADASRLTALGRDFPLMGTLRHPPLSTWLGWMVLQVPYYDGWTAVALQSLLNLIAIRYFWLIGARILNPEQMKLLMITLVTSMLMTIWSMPGYSINEDMAQMPLWAGALHYVLRGIEAPKNLRGWILAGLFIGLATLTKYYAIILVASVVAASVMIPSHRRLWLGAGPWVAVVVALIVVAPHAIWMLNNFQHGGFFWLRMGQAGNFQTAIFSRAFTALFGALILALPGGFILFWAGLRSRNSPFVEDANDTKRFLVTLLAMMLLFGTALALSGIKFHIRFQAPVVGFFLLVNVMFVTEFRLHRLTRQIFNVSVYFWLAIYALAPVLYLFGPPHTIAQEPGPELAAHILKDWDSQFDCGPAYALSEQRRANMIAIYGRRNIGRVPFGYITQTKTYDPAIQTKLGAVLLEVTGDDVLDRMRVAFPTATPTQTIVLPMRRNLTGVTKSYRYSFVPPKGCR